ncbi:MAG: hypothetical protein AAGE59_31225 [Cyanobacteria bacterium P01_F01_bin.86]
MKNLPFHNSNADPLPDANDIEREMLGAKDRSDEQNHYIDLSDASRQRLEADKRMLRNWILGLLLIGLLIGGILAVGLVWTMSRLHLLDPPTLHQQQ